MDVLYLNLEAIELLRRCCRLPLSGLKFYRAVPTSVHNAALGKNIVVQQPVITMPAQTSEADLIFNRASVALARSQRLIASWLPPQSSSELANAKSEEEVEREEQEIFKPEPEL